MASVKIHHLRGAQCPGVPPSPKFCRLCISGLNANFHVERRVNSKLPALDTMVDGQFVTDVYTKPTNLGRCMNGDGDFSDVYRSGTIRLYARGTLQNCGSWQSVHPELKRVHKILVDIGYRNSILVTPTS